jgi:hypothetical protein
MPIRAAAIAIIAVMTTAACSAAFQTAPGDTPSPAKETAPAIGEVGISISPGPTGTEIARAVIDPTAVSRLANEFNALVPPAPGASVRASCSANNQKLEISFHDEPETRPSITASLSGCSASWAVRGPSRDLPPLKNSGHLMTDALQVLGLPSDALDGLPSRPSRSAGG